MEYGCQHRQHRYHCHHSEIFEENSSSLIAIIVVTVAVYLMKMYGGIDCIDTIGDRFSIKPNCPMP